MATPTDMQYGSLESLSTSISLNSRVALLKSSNSLDEIRPGEETPRETGALDDRGRYRLLDESVDFTSSDELCRLQSSPQPCDPPGKVTFAHPPCVLSSSPFPPPGGVHATDAFCY